MTHKPDPIQVYLEIGKTRTFAVAHDWPGWCRSGRDEAAALQALFDVGPAYARVLKTKKMAFSPPSEVAALVIRERLEGNATTDFGAPSLALESDTVPLGDDELARWQRILAAIWQTFDVAVDAARGKELRKGARGGGRELAKVVQHVVDVDLAYLANLGEKLKPGKEDDPEQVLGHVRQAILATLGAAVRGEIPSRGPRGGLRWTPRYFVRRLAWHELDHAWEIEDRTEIT